MTEDKNNRNWIRTIGVSGFVAICTAIYFIVLTYNQVDLNKQEIEAFKNEYKVEIESVRSGLHNHIEVIEERLNKKIQVINELEERAYEHEINFMKSKIEQLKKDHEQDLKIEK